MVEFDIQHCDFGFLGFHGHLKKVYIKKDTHPVYVQETNRLRAKMKELQAIPANKDKVKIVDGKLELDGVTIDRNTFFV